MPEKGATVCGSGGKQRKVVWTESHFEPINRWWDKPIKQKDDPNWTYLEHNGLMFHPMYVPHGIPMRYNGHDCALPPLAEEIANFWCAALTSDYATKPQFISNFWSAFLKSLPSDHLIWRLGETAGEDLDSDAKNESSTSMSLNQGQDLSQTSDDAPLSRQMNKRRKTDKPSFEKADFSRIAEHLATIKEAEKEARRLKTRETRLLEKAEREKVEGPFMYCLHDFVREKVAAYKAEVPGLFRGRGEHPKMGKLKRRILPDEITLNLSEDAPVPRLPSWLVGHAWNDVFHDPSVTWLSYYRDSVAQSVKYVFMGASSAVKGTKDFQKYELARKLKGRIDFIRDMYRRMMRTNCQTTGKSDNVEARGCTIRNCDENCFYKMQLGLATYLIDALALRVGNEKDREEEADTVGCCSLRVEHITDWDDSEFTITLDFLGKDSIRYCNTVKVTPLAYACLKQFTKGKEPQQMIFDLINPSILNKHLREMMQGLSAKVFRTYNASYTLQEELRAGEAIKTAPVKSENGDDHSGALCDRQAQIKNDTFTNLDRAKRFYEDANRAVAILCNHQRSVPKSHDTTIAKLQKQLESYKLDIQEISDFLEADVEASQWKWDAEPTLEEPRISPIKPNMKKEAAMTKLANIRSRAGTFELRMKMKEENKAVANSTSKQHYMDPRITVAFCKRYDLPIEKFFNATLLKKFPWAMFAKSDFDW